MEAAPDTRIDEIADGIYRISTFVPDIAPPAGFTFNEFLIAGEEPLLFHTGPKMLFPLITEAVATVVAPERMRWISFGHIEADEFGSMNDWLGVAPDARVACGETQAMLSVNDLAAREPEVMADGDVLDLGGKRVRFIATPHVPHNWEAQVLFEETTGTLLCGDLFTNVGNGSPVTERDLLGPAIETEAMFHASSVSAHGGATLRRLAELEPTTLAVMHGSSFAGDGGGALRGLADEFDREVRETLEAGLAVAAVGGGCPEL